jgi:hypothetical protein
MREWRDPKFEVPKTSNFEPFRSLLGQQEYITQDAQKGRSARPQRAKRRGVRFGTLSL